MSDVKTVADLIAALAKCPQDREVQIRLADANEFCNVLVDYHGGDGLVEIVPEGHETKWRRRPLADDDVIWDGKD